MSARDLILEMVTAWQDELSDQEASARLSCILADLRFLERTKFNTYVPTLYSRHPSVFAERFHSWLNNPNLTSAEKRDLFEFTHCIAFFSFDDFVAMFQNAFSGPISRWCMSHAGICLTQTGWQDLLNEERFNHTWFCPITDSLLISVFHHVNGIEGKERKPAFRDLKHFGDVEKIRKYIDQQKYKRIVLLEDFVGTGMQSEATVEWAVRTLDLPVMFCPMIIATEGADRYRSLKAKLDAARPGLPDLPEFNFKPVFELSSDCFVYSCDTPQDSLFDRVRKMAEEIHTRLCKSQEECKEGALGYWNDDSPQKGATVIMFSNTPDNSLPLFHHGAGAWKPLFPRVARQPL
ncbi:MAG: hypothetical protein GHCLOJNM_00200 [bacterium]|nr:hypothetical protein [bacterium]